MKVYKQNNQFFMEDNNQVTELIPNDDRYLKLPTNSCNRVWVSCAKVEKAPNQSVDYGNEVKVARTNIKVTERKPLEDYLNEKDKATFLALIEKAKKAREEANKKTPMTKEEKLLKVIERAQAQIAALKAQQKIEEVK